MYRSTLTGVARTASSSWATHLYIATIAVLAQAIALGQGPAPDRELLNSERIAAVFGSYGVEVLEQDTELRVSNLFSTTGDERTCRTFALVRFAPVVDPEISAEHAAIVAGGSIGAVFASQGWDVRKTHLRYGERAATERLARLMRVAQGTLLAEHVYVLDVVKGGREIEYAALVEIHHPDYLGVADLPHLYGAPQESRAALVESLLATVVERSR